MPTMEEYLAMMQPDPDATRKARIFQALGGLGAGLLGGGGLALDPTSLIYGPVLARTFAKGAASGVYPNIAGMVPRLQVNPIVANQLLAGGRGLSAGLLAQSE